MIRQKAELDKIRIAKRERERETEREHMKSRSAQFGWGLNNRDHDESRYYVALIHLNALLSRILGTAWRLANRVIYSADHDGPFRPIPWFSYSRPVPKPLPRVHTPDPDGAMTICNEAPVCGDQLETRTKKHNRSREISRIIRDYSR